MHQLFGVQNFTQEQKLGKTQQGRGHRGGLADKEASNLQGQERAQPRLKVGTGTEKRQVETRGGEEGDWMP